MSNKVFIAKVRVSFEHAMYNFSVCICQLMWHDILYMAGKNGTFRALTVNTFRTQIMFQIVYLNFAHQILGALTPTATIQRPSHILHVTIPRVSEAIKKDR
jgi:hypothetical protein